MISSKRKIWFQNTCIKAVLVALCTAPNLVVAAPISIGTLLPVEMSLFAYLTVGILLIVSVLTVIQLNHRYKKKAHQLNTTQTELELIRRQLTETKRHLHESELNLSETTTQNQKLNENAAIGIFKLDENGDCTFINHALQKMSGLYLKKAKQSGLISVIHPDDQDEFQDAWNTFETSGSVFSHSFRFLLPRNREVHATCLASRISSGHQQTDGYIGWITNVDEFQDAVTIKEELNRRLQHFIGTTVEGFYKLVPTKPIPLSDDPDKMANTILEEFALADCTPSFAALYDTKAASLIGLKLADITEGCGPLKDLKSIKNFIKNEYKSIGQETTRQDSNGHRVNLENNIIGIVQDNYLVGIWGSHRDISQQKREHTKLTNQAAFMNRILNALPADVHVKDTRCRYLFASSKLASRTGIAQKEWLGKTIFEVMPSTPADHDETAIETMKSGKLLRTERQYQARGKTGWMETLQIPLVSDEGLVEGVVSLSLEISKQKEIERQFKQENKGLNIELKRTKSELTSARVDYSETAISLSDTLKKLKFAEAEKITRENEFNAQHEEQRKIAQNLQNREQRLITRQRKLEEQLNKRLEELDSETNKRRKWEEVISIKEDELRHLEMHTAELKDQFDRETAQRTQLESNLKTHKDALNKLQQEQKITDRDKDQKIQTLNVIHQKAFETEKSARSKAEKQLKRTEDLLQKTQAEIKTSTEKHTHDLEAEITERKAATERLEKTMKELETLRQNFSARVESETKTVKQELARKQIREKALRKESKDLEKRIRDLEEILRDKTRENNEKIQALEGAEVEKHQIKQKMELLTKQQQSLVNRETQKLDLKIAEIQLGELKLRKKTGDIQHERDELQKTLAEREAELLNMQQRIQTTETALTETQASLKNLSGNMDKTIAQQTDQLHQELEKSKQHALDLETTIENLKSEQACYIDNLKTRNHELINAGREYQKVVDAYKTNKEKLKNLQEHQSALIEEKTESLNADLKRLKRIESALSDQSTELQQRISRQQDEIHELSGSLKSERNEKLQAENALQKLESTLKAHQENTETLITSKTKDLKELIEKYKQSESMLEQKLTTAESLSVDQCNELNELKQGRAETRHQLHELEKRLSGIKQEHQLEVDQALKKVQAINQTNRKMVMELNEVVHRALTPVIKSTLLMEKSDNLYREQKQELQTVNASCRKLIELINYRRELTDLAENTGAVNVNEFDLHHMLNDIDTQFGHQAKTKKLFFAVSFAQYQANDNVPKMVKADGEKVHRVLSILLTYAIERTNKGRIGLHTTRTSSEAEMVNINFELAFTGIEPKDQLLESIFTPNGTAQDMEYGLTLASHYAESLGGTISIENRKEGITALMLKFPFEKVESTPPIQKDKHAKQENAGAA